MQREAEILLNELGSLDLEKSREQARGVDVLLTGRQRIEEELIASTSGLRFIQVHGRAPWAVDWDAAARAAPDT